MINIDRYPIDFNNVELILIREALVKELKLINELEINEQKEHELEKEYINTALKKIEENQIKNAVDIIWDPEYEIECWRKIAEKNSKNEKNKEY